MLIHRNSATCWPQIQLENGSRLISALMQNCWAVQDCRMHFMSKLYTLALGPDTRTPGLKRSGCSSEITNFSYLVWFTDQGKKSPEFLQASNLCALSIQNAVRWTSSSGNCWSKAVSWVTTALSSPFPAGLTKRQTNLFHRLVRNYLCLFCVWPFGFTSRIKGTGMRHGAKCSYTTKCSFNLGHQDCGFPITVGNPQWQMYQQKLEELKDGNPALHPLHWKVL